MTTRRDVAEQVSGKYVCCSCIDDTFLKDSLLQSMTECECNFCGVRSAEISIVLTTFEITKDLLILDSARVPDPRSDFDDTTEPQEDITDFLAKFARDITLPVSKDGSEHINYLPTQVVSEYFAQVFKPNRPDSAGLDGVMNGFRKPGR